MIPVQPANAGLLDPDKAFPAATLLWNQQGVSAYTYIKEAEGCQRPQTGGKGPTQVSLT